MMLLMEAHEPKIEKIDLSTLIAAGFYLIWNFVNFLFKKIFNKWK